MLTVFVCVAAGKVRIHRQDRGQAARETFGRRLRETGIPAVVGMVRRAQRRGTRWRTFSHIRIIAGRTIPTFAFYFGFVFIFRFSFIKQLPNALVGESTVLPRLPDPKDSYSLIDGQHHEPILPIPKDIRPTLAKYRYNATMAPVDRTHARCYP